MVIERVGSLIVGGGVIGLAIARTMALAGMAPLVLEREPHFGSATSSRNSEVIHAGLYYTRGSLKAQLCVEGNKRLYAFCENRGVAYRRLGKLIFALDGTGEAALADIEQSARTAGVADLEWLSGARVEQLEPELRAKSALWSPSTGIVDSHGFMLALLGEAEAHGAQLICNTTVRRAARVGGSWRIWLDGDDGPVVEAPILINAAGLGAQGFAYNIDGLDAKFIPQLHLARGLYFTYAGAVPFRHLIYPIPEPGGLGAHLTLDLAGQARFGPDVEWIEKVDYAVDVTRRASFVSAAQRIWPSIEPDRLQAGYAGIRPKLSGPGEPPADFVISTAEEHGLSGLTNLFGIEVSGFNRGHGPRRPYSSPLNSRIVTLKERAMYPQLSLYISGRFIPVGPNRNSEPVLDPSTGRVIAQLPHATPADLDEAVDAAVAAFPSWRRLPAIDRSRILRRAADILRERENHIAEVLTREQGKSINEAKGELSHAIDLFDWFADEARRAYGRVIPARSAGIQQ